MLETIERKLSAVPAKPLTVTEAQWLLSEFNKISEKHYLLTDLENQ